MIFSKLLKPFKLFKSREQVAKFRQDLEAGTQERFEKIDRDKCKVWAAARDVFISSPREAGRKITLPSLPTNDFEILIDNKTGHFAILDRKTCKACGNRLKALFNWPPDCFVFGWSHEKADCYCKAFKGGSKK